MDTGQSAALDYKDHIKDLGVTLMRNWTLVCILLKKINKAYRMLGIRTFCSPVFSLLGANVPSGNLRSQERKFPGTFAAGNEGSRERMYGEI